MGQRVVISRELTAKNFVAAMAFLNAIGTLAEEEGHHPVTRLGLEANRTPRSTNISVTFFAPLLMRRICTFSMIYKMDYKKKGI